MALEEWEQAKAQVSEQGTHTRLNSSTPAGGGHGGGDLVVRDSELGALGNMAYDLRQRLSAGGDYARSATYDASIELLNDGMDTGSALLELHDAWSSKMRTLLEACAHISNHLDYTRGEHAKDEVKVVTDMKNAEGGAMTVSSIHDYIK